MRYWRRNGQYWTVAKAANAALARLAYHLKLSYVPARPVVAKIEATNACNGTCRLCPVGAEVPGRRPVGMMRWELYTELVEKLKGCLVALDVTNWGESLLHPRILEMIRYAHDARIYTYLSTNLHTVADRHVDGLMRTGLDELALSLHGLSDETYSAYQPGFDFQEACGVIRKLVDARRRHGLAKRMKIKISFVVTAVNEHELSGVAAFAEKMGVSFVIGQPSLNLRFRISPEMARQRPDEAREIMRAEVEQWLPSDRRYVRKLYYDAMEQPGRMYDPAKAYPCDWPWQKLVVNHDGGASICCGSYRAGSDVGQYVGQPVAELWNSPAYRRCRRTFADGGKADPSVLCGRCPGLLL